MRQEISVFELSGKSKILSGATRGQLFFGKLVTAVTRQAVPQPLFLNYNGVELMTSSFFRAAILPFRDYCVDKLGLYPVLANISSPETLDEINVVVEPKRDAVIICKLSSRGEVSDAQVVGVLDEKQQLTLNAVLEEKEADASILKERHQDPSDEIGITGWNNRLAALVVKGLLIEFKKGRGKLYRPVVELG